MWNIRSLLWSLLNEHGYCYIWASTIFGQNEQSFKPFTSSDMVAVSVGLAHWLCQKQIVGRLFFSGDDILSNVSIYQVLSIKIIECSIDASIFRTPFALHPPAPQVFDATKKNSTIIDVPVPVEPCYHTRSSTKTVLIKSTRYK